MNILKKMRLVAEGMAYALIILIIGVFLARLIKLWIIDPVFPQDSAVTEYRDG